MPRLWIYCIGWLVFGLCVALALPPRVTGLQTVLRGQIDRQLRSHDLAGVDVRMDGQAATLAYHDAALTPLVVSGLLASGETAHDRMQRAAVLALGVSGSLGKNGAYGGPLMGPVTKVTIDRGSVDAMQARLDGAAVEATSVAQSSKAARSCTDEVAAAVADRRLQYVSGSAELTGDSQAILADIARTVKSCPLGLVLHVEGYTDSQGQDADNMKLSTARAEAAAFALTDLGLAQATVRAEGFGAKSPVADNATEAGRAENRRVEFVLRPQDNEGP